MYKRIYLSYLFCYFFVLSCKMSKQLPKHELSLCVTSLPMFNWLVVYFRYRQVSNMVINLQRYCCFSQNWMGISLPWEDPESHHNGLWKCHSCHFLGDLLYCLSLIFWCFVILLLVVNHCVSICMYVRLLSNYRVQLCAKCFRANAIHYINSVFQK